MANKNDKTLIQISRETWQELNQKKIMNESFDEVIKRIIHSYNKIEWVKKDE